VTSYQGGEFTSNEIAGAVAAAALHDLHVNNFVFQGFPAVVVSLEDEMFMIRLSLGSTSTEAMPVPFNTGKQFAKAFRKKEQISSDWFRKVQDLLIELERKSSAA